MNDQNRATSFQGAIEWNAKYNSLAKLYIFKHAKSRNLENNKTIFVFQSKINKFEMLHVHSICIFFGKLQTFGYKNVYILPLYKSNKVNKLN